MNRKQTSGFLWPSQENEGQCSMEKLSENEAQQQTLNLRTPGVIERGRRQGNLRAELNRVIAHARKFGLNDKTKKFFFKFILNAVDQYLDNLPKDELFLEKNLLLDINRMLAAQSVPVFENAQQVFNYIWKAKSLNLDIKLSKEVEKKIQKEIIKRHIGKYPAKRQKKVNADCLLLSISTFTPEQLQKFIKGDEDLASLLERSSEIRKETVKRYIDEFLSLSPSLSLFIAESRSKINYDLEKERISGFINNNQLSCFIHRYNLVHPQKETIKMKAPSY